MRGQGGDDILQQCSKMPNQCKLQASLPLRVVGEELGSCEDQKTPSEFSDTGNCS